MMASSRSGGTSRQQQSRLSKGGKGGGYMIRVQSLEKVMAYFLLLMASCMFYGGYLAIHYAKTPSVDDSEKQQQQQLFDMAARREADMAKVDVGGGNEQDNNSGGGGDGPSDTGKASDTDAGNTTKPMQYSDWQNLAMDLARLPPEETLRKLEEDDPFGTNAFEAALIEAETKHGRTLTIEELQELFPCPHNQRMSLPDARNLTKSQQFKAGDPNTFLFFQHLRKAGGTHFCSLAEINLPKSVLPQYYCMPDYYWPDGKRGECAGCLKAWSNSDIIRLMPPYRIAGNEWDAFDPFRHFELPAVFVASFRRPMDRALSQFRFECIEDRGCHIKDPGEWWEKRQDLFNVYLWTFSKTKTVRKLTINKSLVDERAEAVKSALDTIAQFHLVLVMEWLAYSGHAIQTILGFQNVSSVTKRVRPHIAQFQRDDKQEKNQLGAAGIAKASWTPKEYLKPEVYEAWSHSLALDEILTDAARRLFLERLVCPDIES